jgi:hypothetical protein
VASEVLGVAGAPGAAEAVVSTAGVLELVVLVLLAVNGAVARSGGEGGGGNEAATVVEVAGSQVLIHSAGGSSGVVRDRQAKHRVQLLAAAAPEWEGSAAGGVVAVSERLRTLIELACDGATAIGMTA